MRVLVGVRQATIVAAIVGAAPAAPATAGEPVIPNCVGTTFSGAADALPPGGVGQVVVGFAQDGRDRGPGLGGGIQALQAGLVPDTDDATTPDGMIAFVGGHRQDEDVPQFDEIYVVRADGSGLRALTSSPDDQVYAPTWSPSGDRLAYLRVGMRRVGSEVNRTTDVRLVIIDPSTGVETLSVSLPAPTSGELVSSLEWSPDGGSIVVNRDPSFDYQMTPRLSIVDIETGDWSVVTGHDGLRWSPDGRWMALYTSLGDEVLVVPSPVEGTTTDLNGDLARLLEARSLSVADDGRLVTPPAWAPDGSTFALTVDPAEGRNPHVEIISVPDGIRRTLADQGFSPAWSPEGRHIAYMPDRTETCCGGGAPVEVITPDGADSRQVGSSFIPPTWTPDGTAVVVLDEEGLYTVNPDTRQTTRLTPPRLRPSDASIEWLSGIETFGGSNGAWGDFGPDSQPLPLTTAEEDTSSSG
jgi:Tol biopolymer transport system component